MVILEHWNILAQAEAPAGYVSAGGTVHCWNPFSNILSFFILLFNFKNRILRKNSSPQFKILSNFVPIESLRDDDSQYFAEFAFSFLSPPSLSLYFDPETLLLISAFLEMYLYGNFWKCFSVQISKN